MSAATPWEIGVKRALGKLEASRGLDSVTGDGGFLGPPIRLDHTECTAAPPRSTGFPSTLC